MSKEKKWCINDTLFFPLGIVNNSSKEKTVFVTWTYDYLMSFIFKKDEDNSSILTDVIRIPVDHIITNILVLKTNTIVLMDNGNVYYFSSPKNIKRIHSLNDIRCINSSFNGFCVVRILKDNKINLEVHTDLEDSNQIGSNFQQYDITFDEKNHFNSSWSNERFTITSVRICESNISFLALLTKCKLNKMREIYVFSINNYLFCLCPEDDETDYNINQLATYASDIEMIQILYKSNIFLVFLNSGIIEILFESKISKMIDKIVHCVGNEFLDCTFSNDSFFYSDGMKIYKINFDYDELLHTCIVHTINNNIRGIVAITWVESIKKIVCLSENNIFYRCKFGQSDYNRSNQNDDDTYFELTEEKVRELKMKINILKALEDKPAQIQKQIDDEYLKQDIISFHKNANLFSKHLSATIRLHSESYSELYHLVISFICSKPETFQNISWKLFINIKHGMYNKMKVLPFDKDSMQLPLQIPLSFRKNAFFMIPKINIRLVTFVNVTNDYLCVSVPINIDEVKPNDAFSENNIIPASVNKIVPLLAPFNNHHLFKANDKQYEFCIKLKIPRALTATDVTTLFGLDPRTEPNDFILQLNFIGKIFTLQFNKSESFICLKCRDPVVLFYAKTVIITEICSNNYSNLNEFDLKQIRKALWKLKAEVDSIQVNLTQPWQAKENLIKFYEKLRERLKEF